MAETHEVNSFSKWVGVLSAVVWGVGCADPKKQNKNKKKKKNSKKNKDYQVKG